MATAQKKLMFHEEMTLIKQVHQKNICLVIIDILQMLDLNLNHMFLMNVMMY